MGTFKYPLRISGMDSRYTLDIEATVDTGSLYTTLPASLLRQLGIEPMGRRRFLVGDGRRIQMDIGEARVTINGENVSTIVAFGEEDAPPVLGAYTLEGFALAVDLVEQRLIPLDPSCCRWELSLPTQPRNSYGSIAAVAPCIASTRGPG